MPPLTSRDFQKAAGQRFAAGEVIHFRLGGGSIVMINTAAHTWEAKRTNETREVEKVLLDAGFERVDAYRYNSASIRVRVVDPKFEGLAVEKRDELVEPCLEKLPENTQEDIINLFTFAPSELQQTPKTLREFLMNAEFDDPSPSML